MDIERRGEEKSRESIEHRSDCVVFGAIIYTRDLGLGDGVSFPIRSD